MNQLGAVTSANVKCAKCQEVLGGTGSFTVFGSDWYHSWCAPRVQAGEYGGGTLQKLYGDKSEQYVAERLAHEETRKLLSETRDMLNRAITRENRLQSECDRWRARCAELEALRQ